MSTYYEILGVSVEATHKQIKIAYKAAAKLTHPDHGGEAEQFKLIGEAWHCLSDVERRERYDLSLPNATIGQAQTQAPKPETQPSPSSQADMEFLAMFAFKDIVASRSLFFPTQAAAIEVALTDIAQMANCIVGIMQMKLYPLREQVLLESMDSESRYYFKKEIELALIALQHKEAIHLSHDDTGQKWYARSINFAGFGLVDPVEWAWLTTQVTEAPRRSA